MTQHQMNCILTLARTLNFTAAADEIHITQPTLSYQITQAEDELGIKLFERSKKEVHITENGKRIIEEIQSIYNSMLNLQSMAEVISSENDKKITVAHYDSGNDPLFLPMLQKMKNDYPDCEIGVKFGNYYEMEGLLLNGEADIIFINSGLIKSNLIEHIVLEKGPVYAYLNKNHPLASKSKLNLDDVEGETFLLHSLDAMDLFCWHARYFAEHPERYKLVKYETREERLFRANLGEGIMLSGYKIINVPENAVVIPFVDGDDTSSCIACLKRKYPLLKDKMENIAKLYASRPE